MNANDAEDGPANFYTPLVPVDRRRERLQQMRAYPARINVLELLNCGLGQSDRFSRSVPHAEDQVASPVVRESCEVLKIVTKTAEIELLLELQYGALSMVEATRRCRTEKLLDVVVRYQASYPSWAIDSGTYLSIRHARPTNRGMDSLPERETPSELLSARQVPSPVSSLTQNNLGLAATITRGEAPSRLSQSKIRGTKARAIGSLSAGESRRQAILAVSFCNFGAA